MHAVVKYWPEFASEGKEDVRFADILRHESGLAWLNHTFSWDDLSEVGIQANKVSSVIESQPLVHVDRDTVTRAYHSLTQGFIFNEIVRRVDPKGRTLSKFISDEIRQPFSIDLHLAPGSATAAAVRGRVADTNIRHPVSFGWRSLLPWDRSVPSLWATFLSFYHLFSGLHKIFHVGLKIDFETSH